jgi:hypothetical protein
LQSARSKRKCLMIQSSVQHCSCTGDRQDVPAHKRGRCDSRSQRVSGRKYLLHYVCTSAGSQQLARALKLKTEYGTRFAMNAEPCLVLLQYQQLSADTHPAHSSQVQLAAASQSVCIALRPTRLRHRHPRLRSTTLPSPGRTPHLYRLHRRSWQLLSKVCA